MAIICHIPMRLRKKGETKTTASKICRAVTHQGGCHPVMLTTRRHTPIRHAKRSCFDSQQHEGSWGGDHYHYVLVSSEIDRYDVTWYLTVRTRCRRQYSILQASSSSGASNETTRTQTVPGTIFQIRGKFPVADVDEWSLTVYTCWSVSEYTRWCGTPCRRSSIGRAMLL